MFKGFLRITEDFPGAIRYLASEQRKELDKLGLDSEEGKGLTAFLDLMYQTANNYDAANRAMQKVIAVAEANLEVDKAING